MRRSTLHVSLPPWLIFFFAGLLLLGFLSANPLLTPLCLVTPVVFIRWLWRAGEPPILMFAALWQWLQVSLKVFYCDFIGLSLETHFGDVSLENAAWLSLAGVWALAAGMGIGQSGTAKSRQDGFHDEVPADPKRLFRLYLLFSVLSEVALRYLARGGLAQILIGFAQLKWAIIFALGYTALREKRNKGLLWFVSGVEFLVGFGSYFADFRMILFVIILVFLTLGYRFSKRQVVAIAVCLVAGVVLGSAWSQIKGQYRHALSMGQAAQVINITWAERMNSLFAILGGLDSKALNEGVILLVDRVAYIDLFAYTLQYVPRVVPHEEGSLWWRAFTHVATPRLFFPDKEGAGSDSERTRKYSGLHVAGDEQGTSISLGYLAETYVDFGAPLMFLPVFALGLFWGRINRYFLGLQQVPVSIRYGVAVAVLLNAMYLENSPLKLIGSGLMGFILAALLLHFFGKKITKWAVRRGTGSAS